MTREELIRIAQEVAILVAHDRHQDAATRLERFAELVAAAEREACAKVAEKTLRGYTQAVTGVAEAIRARSKT